MKKVYIIYTGFILAVFFSTIAIGQVTVFEDNFDSYIAGQQISCQAPTVWKTWTNNPCSATEDAYISNSYSFNGINSLKIIQNNDIVREIGTPITTGIAEINFRVFIPTGKSGYFNTLADFNPPTYAWAMQIFFNSTGNATIDAGATSAATFSYPQNQWFAVKIIADLTADSGKFYLNNSLIHKWKWTLGTSGSTIAKQLDGNDFYGYVATDEMYIDDYNIVQIPTANKTYSTSVGGDWNNTSTWVNGILPNQNRTAEIVPGAVVTLTSNVTNRNRSTIINGTLICNNFYLSGTADFVLGGGGTLVIGAVDGISTSSTTGNIRVTGTRSFNQYANYVYNGTSAQITGNGLPANVSSLTINNSLGVTLTSNISVSNLNLTLGNLITGTNSVSVGTSVTNIGILAGSGKVFGNLKRWLTSSGPVVFPVGPNENQYTPVVLSNIVGTGTFSVNAVDGPHPNAVGANILQMYWKLTNGGVTSTDLTFNYLDSDVVGDENQYELGRYEGGWAFPTGTNNTPIIDINANTAFISGVSAFSDWTLGFPQALPVELSSFSSTIIGNTVKLKWQTKTETNNYGFEIERASSSTTPIWSKIGFVNGNGNSNSPKNYSYVDNFEGKPDYLTGKYSYRLKQIDNDGQFEYSEVINVVYNKPTEFSLDQNYPNPFNPKTRIGFSIPTASIVKIIVYNLIGEEIATLINEFKEAGYHSVDFNAQYLNSGIYIYKIESGTFSQTKKMTLIK